MNTYKNTFEQQLWFILLLGSYKNIYSSETNKSALGIRYSNSNVCFLRSSTAVALYNMVLE